MTENFRYLHTMLRVGDLDRSVNFYCTMFGMMELRRRDVPDGKYTLAFLGYADRSDQTELELTYNYGVDKYDLGSGFGHLAISSCPHGSQRGSPPSGPLRGPSCCEHE